MENNNVFFEGILPYYIFISIINICLNKWEYYNLNLFLDQENDIVNPTTFGKKILFNYDNIIYKPSVSVLICTYNRIECLKNVISKLRNQKKNHYQDLEIVVINHGSIDGTTEWLTLDINQDLNITYESRKASLTDVYNLAYQKSKNEYIIFLDDDMEIKNDFIDGHVENFRFKPNAKIFYVGAIIHYTGINEFIGGYHRTIFPTGNCGLSKKLIEEIIRLDGFLFDPIFCKYGWEDTDFGLRMYKHGFKRKLLYKAVSRYIKQSISVDKINLSRRYKQRSRAEMGYLLYKKHNTFEVRLAIGYSFINRIMVFIFTLGGILNKNTIKIFKFFPLLYNYLEEIIVYGFVNQYNIIRKLDKENEKIIL